MRKVKGAELTECQRYWLEQVEACAAAGKTIAEYALGLGIEAKAMYAGKKMLVKKGVLPRTQQARFQRAQVVEPPVAESHWQVRLPNGVAVSFSGTVDAGTLTTVLSTAAAVE